MFNKLINYKFNPYQGLKLNRAQLSKLTKNQLEGRTPVLINGVKGFVGGDGFWTPESIVKKRLDNNQIKMSTNAPDKPFLKV